MTRYGLLADYEYCTGCHDCEIVCQEAHEFSATQWGIRVVQIGPPEFEPDRRHWRNMPVPTQLCDCCSTISGPETEPLCVRSCEAKVLAFGTLAELAGLAESVGYVKGVLAAIS